MTGDPLKMLVVDARGLVVGLLVPLLLCLVAVKVWVVPRLKGKLGEAALRRRLCGLGFPVLSDLIIEATDGTLTQIDHVILTARGIVAIEVKNYAGVIFGTASDRQWTQIIGRQRFRFQNPLRQNFKHTEAVRRLIRAPVGTLVVFVGGARFPNGMPDKVLTLGQFNPHLAALGLPHEGDQQAPAWQRLKEAAQQGRSRKAEHKASLRLRLARVSGR